MWKQQRLLSFETISYRRVMHAPWTAKGRDENIGDKGGRHYYGTQL